MKRQIPVFGSLFAAACLFSLQGMASTTEEWSKVPNYVAKPLSQAAPTADTHPVCRLGDGSELTQSLSSLLGDEVWKSQEDISDALYKSLGDVSLGFDILDKEQMDIQADISPRRRVFFYNAPLKVASSDPTNRIHELNSSQPSKFVVISSLTTKVGAEYQLKQKVPGLSDVNAFVRADLGLQMNYIKMVDSPRTLPATESPLTVDQAQRENLNANNLRKIGFFDRIIKAADAMFVSLEKRIENVADKVTEEDSANVFFDHSLDAFRLPSKLPINLKLVREKMKVGDIVTYSVFSGGGPGISWSTGVLESSASAYLSAGQYIAVRKIDENRVEVHPKIQFERGWNFSPVSVDLGVSLGLVKLSYTPFFWRFEGGRTYALETFLEFDLSDATAAEAFEDMVGLFSLAKVQAMIKNGSTAAKVSEKLYTTAKEHRRRLRLNIGFARLANDHSRQVVKKVATRADGSQNTRWQGEVKTYSYSSLRLLKKSEISTDSQTVIKTNLDQNGAILETTSGNVDGDSLSRVNMTTFYNRNMSRADLDRVLEFVRASVGQSSSVLPESRLAQINEFYKKNKSGRTSLVLLTELDRAALKETLLLDEQDLYQILAAAVLQKSNQAFGTFAGKSLGLLDKAQRETLRNEFTRVNWNHCAVTNLFPARTSQVNCQWVWMTLSQFADGLQKIKNAKTIEAKLNEFTKLESRVGTSPLINHIVIRAYNKQKGVNPTVNYLIQFEPAPGIDPYSFSTDPKLSRSVFRKNQVLAEMTEISRGDKRFKDGVVYLAPGSDGKEQMNLAVETPAYLTPDQRITLWLSDLRPGRVDIPIATAVVNEPIPQLIVADANESLFRYDMTLPQEMLEKVQRDAGNAYELQVRIENRRGEPLSEFGRFLIEFKK